MNEALRNLKRALTLTLAGLCVALAFFWPGWREELRAQSNYFYTVGGGPIGGDVTAIVFDPTNANTVYIATNAGGIFKSADGGTNWVASSSGLWNLQMYGTPLVIDPVTPTTLYAGTWCSGVFKSTNGGANWTVSSSGMENYSCIRALAISPSNPATLYAGTYNAVYKSTDGGATWTNVSSGLANNVTALVVDPGNSNIVYAGTGSGVHKSTNGGGTWSAANSGLFATYISGLVIHPSNASILYVALSCGGVYKSIDGAGSWTAANVGMGSTCLNSLAISPSSPDTLYAGAYRTIYQTTDGAANWTTVGANIGYSSILSVAVNPSSSTTVLAGTYGSGVFRTENGGANWDAINTGLTARAVWALGIDGAAPTNVYAGTASGFFQSPDAGGTWNQPAPDFFYSTGIRSVAVTPPPNSNIVYAGANYGTVFKSLDGGAIWNTADCGLRGDGTQALAIHPTDPSILYAGGNGGVFKTTDGGVNWTAIGCGTTIQSYEIYSLAIDRTNPETVYALTHFNGVFKTTNGGGSWTAVNTGLTDLHSHGVLAIDPSNTATLYVITFGGMFKSTDGGVNWTNVGNATTGLTNLDVRALAINPATPTTLYAGTSGGVFKSADGGVNWTAVNTGLTELDIYALAIDPVNPTILYAATHFSGVFKTSNGGGNWSSTNTGLTNLHIHRGLAIDPVSPNTLYVGTLCGGVFRSSDAGTNWAYTSTGLSYPCIEALAINPLNPANLYAANYYGVEKTTDSGGTWSFAGSGLLVVEISSLAIHPTSPGTIYAGTRGGVFKTTDGGAKWLVVNSGFPSTLFTDPWNQAVNDLVIDPSNPSTLYAGINYLGVFKSTNSGASWTAVNNGLLNPYVQALAINPAVPATLYAATWGGIFKTTDGGANWGQTSFPTSAFSLAIDPAVPSVLYAGFYGGIGKTTDGGANWSVNFGVTHPAINVADLAINPASSATLYAATFGSGVLKSTDFGATWFGAGVADITRPSAVINQSAGQADPTSSSPINFTAAFSEPVTGFAADDVTLSGTAGATATVTGGPSTYNVAVSGMTLGETVCASIAAGAATDAAGNLSFASTSTDNCVTFSTGPIGPPPITIGQTLSATLATTDAVSPRRSDVYADFYQFTLTSTQQLVILMDSTQFIPYLFVTNSEGGYVAQDAFSGEGDNAFIVYTFPAGTYTIEASSWNAGSTGSYTIALLLQPPGSPFSFSTSMPTSVSFTLPAGARGQQSIPISVNSGLPLPLTTSASTSSGGNWLSGFSCCVTPGTATVVANAAGLTPGVYQGTLAVTVDFTQPSPLNIPVTLTVVAAPTTGPIINTVAGTDWSFSVPSGLALDAPLGTILSVAVDSGGNVFLSDHGNGLVGKVTPTGAFSTVGGGNLFGAHGLAADGSGNLYLSLGCEVRKVDSLGNVTTVAGSGCGPFSGDGGPATSATLSLIGSITLDGAGNLYIADTGNQRIRKVDTTGTITTVAGNGTFGFSGDGGPATSASLNSPWGVAVDGSGSLYISDTYNHRIRKVVPGTDGVINGGTDEIISTVAGNGVTGFSGDGGQANSASLFFPHEIVVDGIGNLYIADAQNHRIRKVSTTGVITTFAGTGVLDFSGDGGAATSATLNLPMALAMDATGRLYIGDSNNWRVRRVDATGTIVTVAGNGGYRFRGDGGAATSAVLNFPGGVATDALGNFYIADTSNHRIRKVSASGTITTVAGRHSIPGFSGDGGPATDARLSFPRGVAADSAGNLYIADTSNARIRKVTPSGTITTYAGTGTNGFSGDGGPATSANLRFPVGVAVDGAGNLYIADTFNERIRRVSPGGVITTVAGNGSFGFSGDGGPAASAMLTNPQGVAVDGAGNLYIADSGNNRIRKVSVGGTITTVAGNGSVGFAGDGVPATNTPLNSPLSVAVDAAGNLYFGDSNNTRIRKVDIAGIIRTIAGNGSCCFSGDGGLAALATLSGPQGVAVDAKGSVYITASFSNRIRKVSFPGDITVSSVAGIPGSTVQIPVRLNLSAGFSVDALSFGIRITPTGNAPALSGTLSFTKEASIASNPSLVDTAAGPGVIAVSWLGNLNPTLGGTRVVGTVGVAVPSSATNGQTYTIEVTGASGNLGTTEVAMTAGPPETLTVAPGVLSPGSVLGVPGGTAQVPLTLVLGSGVSIDSLSFGVSVTPNDSAPGLSGALDFVQDASMPVPTETATATTVAVFLNGISPALAGTKVVGTVRVAVPSSAAEGQSYTIRVTSPGGALGLTDIPLAAGVNATLTVTIRDYLVGDVSPPVSTSGDLNGDTDTCDAGEFGSGTLTTTDLILALRAVTNISRPCPLGSDWWDAVDSSPTDSTSGPGGNGSLTTTDLIITLRRVTGIDAARPRRPSGTGQRFLPSSMPGSVSQRLAGEGAAAGVAGDGQ